MDLYYQLLYVTEIYYEDNIIIIIIKIQYEKDNIDNGSNLVASSSLNGIFPNTSS